MEKIQALKGVYYDPEHPAGYSSALKLVDAVRGKHTKEHVLKWLRGQNAYTLHKQIRKKFARNKYHVTNIDDLHEADLVDLRNLSTDNDGYCYLLTIIDVFSKYAWVVALKSKSSKDVSKAFEQVFTTSGRVPRDLRTDKGKEFLCQRVQNLFKRHGINHFVCHNPDVKASVIERFNRTLKTKMYKYFTYTNRSRYIDDIQKMVNSYNSAIHRTIKMAPKDVTASNILQVYKNAFSNTECKQSRQNKLQVSDYVRISKEKNVFEKGYVSNWSEEIFVITKVIKRCPVVYKISDLSGETIDGVFYEPELQKVTYSDADLFKIDKILRKRMRRGRREVFVKWHGYSDKFNSWIPENYLESV